MQRMALITDAHIGYRAGKTLVDGVNLRELDGEKALATIITQIIESGITTVLVGGDIFHSPRPTIRSIVYVNSQLQRLIDSGASVVVIAGNHEDNDQINELPSVEALGGRGVIVESHAMRTLELDTGLLVTLAPHRVVERVEYDARPSDSDVNLLLSHASVFEGAVALHTEEAPREKFLSDDALLLGWDAVLLGHIHHRHFVQGHTNVLYGGSALRRGWSDKAGDRGWTEVRVESDGGVDFVFHDIPQRTQLQLPGFSADGMTGEQVSEKLDVLLGGVEDGAIVRVDVSEIASLTRRGVDQKMLDGHRRRLLTLDVRYALAGSVSGGVSSGDVVGDNRSSLGTVESFKKWSGSSKSLAGLDDSRRDLIVDRSEGFIRSGVEESLSP